MITAGDIHQAWRTLPRGSLDDVIGGGTCLILAPHPDDESLGCGGLIAACVAAGRTPLVVVLTDGAGSHPNSRLFPPERLREARAREVRRAAACLGVPGERVVLLGEPDTAAPRGGPGFDALVVRLVALIEGEAMCTAILATWRHDPHCDHEAASLLAAAVADITGVRHVAYPVWGWTLAAGTSLPDAPVVGFRLDISAFMAVKRAAILAHETQHGGVITDDPTGFQLSAEMLSAFTGPFEPYVRP